MVCGDAQRIVRAAAWQLAFSIYYSPIPTFVVVRFNSTTTPLWKEERCRYSGRTFCALLPLHLSLLSFSLFALFALGALSRCPTFARFRIAFARAYLFARTLARAHARARTPRRAFYAHAHAARTRILIRMFLCFAARARAFFAGARTTLGRHFAWKEK